MCVGLWTYARARDRERDKRVRVRVQECAPGGRGAAWRGMAWGGVVACGVRVGWVAAGLQASRERASSYMSKRFDDNICTTHSRKKYAVAMAQGQVVRY